MALAAGIASLAGAVGDRDAFKVFGGRSLEATFALALLAVVGLVYALVTVQLNYSYVAAMSGFQEPLVWRVAGLWSGPAGGLLLLTLLTAGAGVVSYRLDSSRHAAARTGCLAVLTLIGLSMLLTRALPYAQPSSPAPVGSGLPTSLKDSVWHVEVLATHLAVACGGFAFAGVVAGPLVGPGSERRAERAAMVFAGTLLTVSIFAATWRAYGQSGALFEARGFAFPLAYVPAWLLAYSSLHAPGSIVPTWALRWRRMLEFAFLPTVLGAWAASLLGLGEPGPPRLWAGGLAVGIITGAMAGAGSRDTGVDALRAIPGYGVWAFRGALVALALAGIAAMAGLSGATFWTDVSWAVVLLGLAWAAAWSLSRPAGRWRRVWIWATVGAALASVGTYAIAGRSGLVFALAVGLAVGMGVGGAAEAVRLSRARSHRREESAEARAAETAARRSRTGRRRAASLAHLGLAFVALGVAAEGLTRAESRVVFPGDALALSEWPGRGVRATYLGLSRYQVSEIDKRVATFKLERGRAPAELTTAELLDDWVSGVTGRRPAVRRGILYDTVVSIADVRPGDGVMCRLAARPFALLVWLGWAILVVSTVARWSRVR